MLKKRLISIILAITVIFSMGIFTAAAANTMTLKSYNATLTAVVLDIDTENDISSDSITGKVKLYVYNKGENIEVSSTVSATKNTLVITPSNGLEESKYYFAEVTAGVSDTQGNAVSGTLRTNWFTVTKLYSTDFNIKLDNEGNPVSPYYKDGDTVKHNEWILDSGTRNGITLPSAANATVSSVNGDNTVLGFNNGGTAVLNKSDLPNDYTAEYVYHLPKSHQYANYPYASHRLRIGFPALSNRQKGTGIRIDNWKSSQGTPIVKPVIDGYSGDLLAYEYNPTEIFTKTTVNARISAVGDHFQWFYDNTKLYDISGIPQGSGTIAFMDGSWPNQGIAYIDDVVITKYTDMGKELPALNITGCSASERRVTIEFSDDVDETTVSENITVYKDAVAFTDFTLDTSDNCVYIDLPVNDGSFYRIDVNKGICSTDGFASKEIKQYEFEDLNGSLVQRAFTKPEINNVSAVLNNEKKQLEISYDYTGSYDECTEYEISTSSTMGGAYSVEYSGVINTAQLAVNGEDVFNNKYIKISLQPIDSHGYLGEKYEKTDMAGFMTPVVSGLSVSGTVEGGTLTLNYSFNDENNDSNVSEISWLCSDTPDGTYAPIENASSATLTINGSTDELYDKFIKVQVTAKTAEYPYTGNTITSDMVCRVFKPLANEVKIVGESLVGIKLTPSYKYYDYNGKEQNGTVWKWMRSESRDEGYQQIGTDNQAEYEITNDDIGKFLKLCVVPAKEGVTGDEFYSEVFVLPAYPEAKNVAVSGTALYGYTVSGKYDYYHQGNVKEKDSVYAWYLDNALVSSERNYTIGAADAGKSLVFEVTPKAEKEPSTGTTERSQPVTVGGATVSAGTGLIGNSGSNSGGGGGGGRGTSTTTGVQNVVSDLNTNTKLADENGHEYITAFTDIKDSNYIKEIVRLSDLGIIAGTSATTFEPLRDITRAEAAALICRALNLNSAQTANYTDVSADEWYAAYVNAITEKGFMCGYNGLFRPDDVITTEEMTKVMILVYESKYEAAEIYEGTELPADSSEWAADYLKKALELNWFNDAKTILPLENSVREKAAYLLYNAMGLK